MEKLAIDGGKPVNSEPFPMWPSFSQKAIESVAEPLKSGKVNYWTGELGTKFEKEWAKWNGKFRPYLLGEKYKRSSEDFEEFLISLISNGYSKNQIQRTLKKLELPYSEQEIEKIKENLREKVEDFKTRQLKEDWFCMVIDGSRSQIKNKQVKDAVIYVILLIGLDGKRLINVVQTLFRKNI